MKPWFLVAFNIIIGHIFFQVTQNSSNRSEDMKVFSIHISKKISTSTLKKSSIIRVKGKKHELSFHLDVIYEGFASAILEPIFKFNLN